MGLARESYGNQLFTLLTPTFHFIWSTVYIAVGERQRHTDEQDSVKEHVRLKQYQVLVLERAGLVICAFLLQLS